MAPHHDDSADQQHRLQVLANGVGDLAHRLNNALTTVIGLTDWHLVSQHHGDELRADLEKIRAAAAAAEQAVKEILQLARAAEATAPRGGESPAGGHQRHRAPRSEPPTSARSGAACVLLVDDEPEVRTSLSVMVRTLGYDVHAVPSGPAALEWLERETAGVVVTDLGMPGMNGEELAAALHVRHPRLPVVLLTGWTDRSTIIPPGVTRLLPKPLRMAQLRAALSTLLGAQDP